MAAIPIYWGETPEEVVPTEREATLQDLEAWTRIVIAADESVNVRLLLGAPVKDESFAKFLAQHGLDQEGFVDLAEAVLRAVAQPDPSDDSAEMTRGLLADLGQLDADSLPVSTPRADAWYAARALHLELLRDLVADAGGCRKEDIR